MSSNDSFECMSDDDDDVSPYRVVISWKKVSCNLELKVVKVVAPSGEYDGLKLRVRVKYGDRSCIETDMQDDVQEAETPAARFESGEAVYEPAEITLEDYMYHFMKIEVFDAAAKTVLCFGVKDFEYVPDQEQMFPFALQKVEKVASPPTTPQLDSSRQQQIEEEHIKLADIKSKMEADEQQLQNLRSSRPHDEDAEEAKRVELEISAKHKSDELLKAAKRQVELNEIQLASEKQLDKEKTVELQQKADKLEEEEVVKQRAAKLKEEQIAIAKEREAEAERLAAINTQREKDEEAAAQQAAKEKEEQAAIARQREEKERAAQQAAKLKEEESAKHQAAKEQEEQAAIARQREEEEKAAQQAAKQQDEQELAKQKEEQEAIARQREAEEHAAAQKIAKQKEEQEALARQREAKQKEEQEALSRQLELEKTNKLMEEERQRKQEEQEAQAKLKRDAETRARIIQELEKQRSLQYSWHFELHEAKFFTDVKDKTLSVVVDNTSRNIRLPSNRKALWRTRLEAYSDPNGTFIIKIQGDKTFNGLVTISPKEVEQSEGGRMWVQIHNSDVRASNKELLLGEVLIISSEQVQRQRLSDPHTVKIEINRCRWILPRSPTVVVVRCGGVAKGFPELPATPNPVLLSELTFTVSEYPVLCSVEYYQHDACIGMTEFNISSIDRSDLMLPFLPPSEHDDRWNEFEHGLGSVLLSYQTIMNGKEKERILQKQRSTKSTHPMLLSLTVDGASGLAPASFGHRTCKALVRCLVNEKEAARSTSINSLSPSWKFDVDIPLQNQANDVILEVVNDPLLTESGDGFLGRVQFTVSDGTPISLRDEVLRPRPGNKSDLHQLNKYSSLGTLSAVAVVKRQPSSGATSVKSSGRPLCVHVNVSRVSNIKANQHEPVWVTVEVAGEKFTSARGVLSKGCSSFLQPQGQFLVVPESAQDLTGLVTVHTQNGKYASAQIPLGAGSQPRKIDLLRRGSPSGSANVLFDAPYSERPSSAQIPFKSVYLKIEGANNLTSGDFSPQCEPYAVVYQCKNGVTYPRNVMPESLDQPVVEAGLGDPSDVGQLRTCIASGTSVTWNAVMDVPDTSTAGSRYLAVVMDSHSNEFIGYSTFVINHEQGGSGTHPLLPRSDVPADERRQRFNGNNLGEIVISWTVTKRDPLGLLVCPLDWKVPEQDSDGKPYKNLTSKIFITGMGNTVQVNDVQLCDLDQKPMDFTTFYTSDAILNTVILSGKTPIAVGSIPLAEGTEKSTGSGTAMLVLRKQSDARYSSNASQLSPSSSTSRIIGSVRMRWKWQDVSKIPTCTPVPFKAQQYVVKDDEPLVGVSGELLTDYVDILDLKNGHILKGASSNCQALVVDPSAKIRCEAEQQQFVHIGYAKSLADATERCYASITSGVNSDVVATSRMTTNAVWNQTFTFHASDPTLQPPISIVIRNSEGIFLGEAKLQSHLNSSRCGSDWVQLRPKTPMYEDDSIVQRNSSLGSVYVTWGLSATEPTAAAASPKSAASGYSCSVKDTSPDYCVSYIANLKDSSTHHMVSGGTLINTKKHGIYLVGGYDGKAYSRFVLKFNKTDNTWKSLGVGNGRETAPQRQGHSVVQYKKNLFVFGGFGYGGFDRNLKGMMEKHAVLDNDGAPIPDHHGYQLCTWRYDIANNTWSKVPATGSSLDFRAGHTATNLDHNMVVWGGWKVLVRVTRPYMKTYKVIEHRRNDMCYLNLKKALEHAEDGEKTPWKKVHQNGPIPTCRSEHTMTLIPGDIFGIGTHAMVLFGGVTDGHASDINTPSGSNASTPANKNAFDSDEEEDLVEGASQSPVTPSHKPFNHESGIALNDVHLFDPTTKTWSPIYANGTPPVGRYGHTTTFEPTTSSLLVLGGWGNTDNLHAIFQLDLKASFWRKIQLWRAPNKGGVALSRNGHSCILLGRKKALEPAQPAPEAKQKKKDRKDKGKWAFDANAQGSPVRLRNNKEKDQFKTSRAYANSSSENSLFQLIVVGGLTRGDTPSQTVPASHPPHKGTSVSSGTNESTPEPPRYRLMKGIPHGCAAIHFSPTGLVDNRTKKVPPRMVAQSDVSTETRKLTVAEQLAITAKLSKRNPSSRLQNKRHAADTERLASGKKLTIDEMHQNTERLYYNPLRNSSSKRNVSPKNRKKLNPKEQHYNIERMYYQAVDFKQIAKQMATERVDEEHKRESIHQTKISIGDQLNLADRLYYQPMNNKQAVPDPSVQRPQSPRAMRREDWNSTVDRLYDPHSSTYQSVFTPSRSSTPAPIKKAWRM